MQGGLLEEFMMLLTAFLVRGFFPIKEHHFSFRAWTPSLAWVGLPRALMYRLATLAGEATSASE